MPPRIARPYAGCVSFPRKREKVDDRFQCCAFPSEAGARSAVSRCPQGLSRAAWPGLTHVNIIKTGDRSYCLIAEWKDIDACIKARPNMIATLDSVRDTLEDLGGSLGVTDAAAGPVVLALK